MLRRNHWLRRGQVNTAPVMKHHLLRINDINGLLFRKLTNPDCPSRLPNLAAATSVGYLAEEQA
jgi:hypothetical protein